MTRKSTLRTGIVAGLMTLAMLLSTAPAFAAGGPPPGKGGGGETTLTNNLSVPAIFVPNPGTFATTVTCPGGPTDPSNTPPPLTGYEVPGYYYVQGVHTWQAQCDIAAADTVTAAVDWGDNLTSGALKAGTPIRVEVGMTDSTVSMLGYRVIKLQPSLEDRLSAYGTLATQTDGVYSATQTAFPYTTTDPETGLPVTVNVRVYDIGALFSLYNETTGTYVVPPNTPMGAEINATGAVVYGYNWGVGGHGVKNLPTAGTYVLTFTAPNVYIGSAGVHTASITFVVKPKNSGRG